MQNKLPFYNLFYHASALICDQNFTQAKLLYGRKHLSSIAMIVYHLKEFCYHKIVDIINALFYLHE